MKRKLSLLMVLMMVLTLIPAMPSFATPGQITTQNRTDLVLGGYTQPNNTPMIYLDNNERVPGTPATKPLSMTTETTFTVVLDGNNADFAVAYLAADGVTQVDKAYPRYYTTNGTEIPWAWDSNPVTAAANAAAANATAAVAITRTGDKTIEVRIPNPSTVTAIAIPMHLRATGTGTINARFERLSGFDNVSALYPVATVQSQQSNIIVDKIGNIARNNNIIETRTSQSRVRISENTIGAWNTTEPIEIRLDDSNFTFSNNIVFTMGGASFTLSNTTVAPTTTASNATQVDRDNLIATGTVGFTSTGSTTTTNAARFAELIDGGRTLKIYPNVLRTATASGTNLYKSETRNEVTIDLPIVVSRNAQIGKDVTATVKGQVSPSSVILAKYTDYAVELKAEKVLDVIAGQDVPGRYISTVTFEEMVPGSLLDGRVLEVSLVGADKDGKETTEIAAFQFDETIRLTQLNGTGDLNIVAEELQTNGARNSKSATVTKKTSDNKYKRHDLMEIEINRGSNNASTGSNNVTLKRPIAAKWELKVPFVVATNYEGDLFLKFNGAGMDKQTVKIATVKAPVTIEVGKVNEKLADLNIGQQNQVAPDVTIKEAFAGALVEKDIVRAITNAYGINPDDTKPGIADRMTAGMFFTKGSTTVKEGDAKIDDDDRAFTLKERSSKPSTFVISDIHVTLDRTVPYGEYKIDIDAGNVNARHTLSDRIARVPYFNVVTPHPEDKNILTVFTIGQNSYKQTISGVEKEMPMDATPQIINNRTMMPIRYVADALGAKVNYDVATRTAIFSKDAMVVSMTLDTNIMYVNGSPVVMDTAPVVQADRALVSLVNIAQAFGLNSVSAPATGDIVWDASAKTVTLFPSAQ